MGRRTLRKSDIKELSLLFPKIGLSKKDKVEEENKLLFVNGKPFFFYFEQRLIPHLKLLLEFTNLLPQVVVDMPAVKHLVNGADVMRPGIVEIGETIEENGLVVVKDENYGKPLCICIALFDGQAMKSLEKGKVLRNIHYVGDDIWNAK